MKDLYSSWIWDESFNFGHTIPSAASLGEDKGAVRAKLLLLVEAGLMVE